MNKVKLFILVLSLISINLYATSDRIFMACDNTFETALVFDDDPSTEINCRLNAISDTAILACRDAFPSNTDYISKCINSKKSVTRIALCDDTFGDILYNNKLHCINTIKRDDHITNCGIYFEKFDANVNYCIRYIDEKKMIKCLKKSGVYSVDLYSHNVSECLKKEIMKIYRNKGFKQTPY